MNNQSAMFKCGGKLQQLTDKFAKGGKSKCGCGGIKVAKEGMEVPPEVLKGLMFVEREYTPDGQAVYTMAKSKETLPSNMRSNPFSAYAQNGGEYQGEGQVRIVDDGKGGIRVDADPYGPVGAIQDGVNKEQYIGKLLELLKKAGITPGPAFKKNGGIVKGENGLQTPTISRREALAAAKNTFGFSGSQARRAYANAKKGLRAQGLRGAELKQRAREMMFKMPTINEDITIEEPEIQLPEISTLNTSAPIVHPITPVAPKDPLAGMTDEQLAQAVIAGKYGSGAARRQALGDRYDAVQSIINRGFRKPTQPTQPAQNTTWEGTFNQLSANVPDGFVSNTPVNGNFSINSSRPANEFGARALIERNERMAQRGPITEVVYPYTTGTVTRRVPVNNPPKQKPSQVIYPYTIGTVVRQLNTPANEKRQIVYPYTTGEVVVPYKCGGKLPKEKCGGVAKSLKCGGKSKKKK